MDVRRQSISSWFTRNSLDESIDKPQNELLLAVKRLAQPIKNTTEDMQTTASIYFSIDFFNIWKNISVELLMHLELTNSAMEACASIKNNPKSEIRKNHRVSHIYISTCMSKESKYTH